MANEFPAKYPTEAAFVQASEVLSYNTVMSHEAGMTTPAEISRILSLMTPQEIRSRRSHSPFVISPNGTPFDELLTVRDHIRDLQIAPKRSDDVQASYQQMSGDTFLRIVQDHYLEDSPMALVRELYPSGLGRDVQQYVLWIRDDNTPPQQIAEFIGKIVHIAGLTLDDVIMFERSRSSDTPFVKVAVPQYRHIHLWLRSN